MVPFSVLSEVPSKLSLEVFSFKKVSYSQVTIAPQNYATQRLMLNLSHYKYFFKCLLITACIETLHRLTFRIVYS